VKKLARKPASTVPARREPRIQHLSELHISYEGHGYELQIRAPDLSPHGMFVNTTTHFPEGAIVNVRFRLTQSEVEVQTRCEVRYCLPGIGIGVEFVGLGAEQVRAIEKELQFFSRPRDPKNRERPGKAHK
jgi:PilZ domain